MLYCNQKTLTRFKNWFCTRYYFTLESLGVTSIVMVIWILSYYLMSVFSNIASSRSPDNTVYPQLPDVGFDILPQIDTLWMTDFFDALLAIPTIILILTHRKPAYVGITWMLTSTLCNIERIASVAITSFPDPRPGCEKVSDNFFSKFTPHKCGDCMFSGHTVLFVICACAWTTHTPMRRSFSRILVIFTVWSLVAAGSIIVIMNRAHYTVDVLVAWYVGIGNWYSVNYLWNEHCIRKGYLKSINWPAQRLLATDAGYQILDSPTFDNYYSGDINMNEKCNHQPQGLATVSFSRSSSNRNISSACSSTSSDDNSDDMLCDKAVLSHYHYNGYHQRVVSTTTTAFINTVASLDIEQQQPYLVSSPPSSSHYL